MFNYGLSLVLYSWNFNSRLHKLLVMVWFLKDRKITGSVENQPCTKWLRESLHTAYNSKWCCSYTTKGVSLTYACCVPWSSSGQIEIQRSTWSIVSKLLYLFDILGQGLNKILADRCNATIKKIHLRFDHEEWSEYTAHASDAPLTTVTQ